MKTVPILGIPVSQVNYDSALNCITQWVEEPNGKVHSVVAANAHVITETVLNPEFRDAIISADMTVPDGMPLVWASRILGSKIRDRCYGPTLMRKTLEESETKGFTHYFYGSTQDTLAKLAETINKTWPGTTIAGVQSPTFGDFVDEVELANISAINQSGAQILWVAMGCPKQELWMHRYRRHLAVKVVLGVGAAFDFVAGIKPRAPRWMQRIGMEWFFRLCCEPRRLWRRYLIRNPLFVVLLALQLCRLKRFAAPNRGAGPQRSTEERPSGRGTGSG